MLKKVFFSLFFLILFVLSLFPALRKGDIYFNKVVSHFVGDYRSGVAIIDGEGFALYNGTKSAWTFRNEGLSQKNIYPFMQLEYRKLTAMGQSSLDSNLVAVSDGIEIFLSSNLGLSWQILKREGGLPASAYITALYPHNETLIYCGTSCQGIYEGTISGNRVRWKALSRTSDFFYMGAGSYEQVNALFIDDLENPNLFLSLGFGRGVYSSSYVQGGFPANNFPQWKPFLIPFSEEVIDVSKKDSIYSFYTEKAIYYFDSIKNEWISAFNIKRNPIEILSPQRVERHEKAVHRKGIYVRWDNVERTAKFDSLIKTIKEAHYNSLVVDLKNDMGVLCYDSQNRLAKELNAVNGRIDVKKLVERVRKENLYLIARVVVFKDQKLFFYDNHKYALWNLKKNAAWGNWVPYDDEKSGEKRYYQKEHWVDPFCEEVWHYNVEIAKELQELGVDEIQFDYIRFPSDGPTAEIYSRYAKSNMIRIDALESFLRYARQYITIPISTDLYGYQSYYQMGNWIGQSIGMFSEYVDVICPMYYPSHFHRYFNYHADYGFWAREIYRTGCDRSRRLTKKDCIIRPYVQAFLMGSETAMQRDEYKRYFEQQLKGVEMSAAKGFTLWNNANNYYMLE